MRNKDKIVTSIKAFISLINVNLFNEDLTSIDFEKEINSNKQLASSSSEKKEDFLKRLKGINMERGRLLRKKLCHSFFWIFLGLLIGFLFKLFFNISNLDQFTFFFKNINPNNYFGISSIVLFSVATLGRLGWEGQSNAGDTVYEQLDKRIFWILYLIGTILGSLSILW